MASRDHTARAYLLVRNEPNTASTSSIDDSPHPPGDESMWRQTYASKRAGSALAIAAIEGMLKTHRRFAQANKDGKRMGLLPFNPVQLIGLETAIDLLQQYVDTLDPETGG
jgi:hypothetical protein